MGGALSYIFFGNSHPLRQYWWFLWGTQPSLKNEAPRLRNKPPLPHWNMKHPSLKWFLEKAQYIITYDLAKILEKYVWRSSFLVNLQAFRLIAGNFTIKWTPSLVFFYNILSFPHAPLMFWLKPPSPCLQNLWETFYFVLKLEAGGQKMPQNFLQSTWKTEYEKSNNIWIIYWW